MGFKSWEIHAGIVIRFSAGMRYGNTGRDIDLPRCEYETLNADQKKA